MGIRGSRDLPQATKQNAAVLGFQPEPQCPARACATWLLGLLFPQCTPVSLGRQVALMGCLCAARRGEEEAGGPRELRTAWGPPAPATPPLWDLAVAGEPQHLPPTPSPPQPAAVRAAAPYHLDGVSSVGGSDLAILSRTRMGLSSWCGGSIWAISISVMPRDQMSAL